MGSNNLKVLKKENISDSQRYLPKHFKREGGIDLILSRMCYGRRNYIDIILSKMGYDRCNYIYFVDVGNNEWSSGMHPSRVPLGSWHDEKEAEKKFEEYKKIYLNSP